MESRAPIASAEQRGSASELAAADESALSFEVQEGREEAFEAVIVRLDHASAERLFRMAGM